MEPKYKLLTRAWISTLLGPLSVFLMTGVSAATVGLGLFIAILLEAYAIRSFRKANHGGWSVLGIVVSALAIVGVLFISFFVPASVDVVSK